MVLAASLTPHDWQTACTAPDVADSTPDWNDPASIVRPEQGYILVNPLFQEVEFRLRYDDTPPTVSANPIIQVWGKFADGTWERLADSSGTYLQTLTTTPTTDQADGTYLYTPPQSVRLVGAATLLFAVQTAFAVSVGSATSIIEARGKITRIVV